MKQRQPNHQSEMANKLAQNQIWKYAFLQIQKILSF